MSEENTAIEMSPNMVAAIVQIIDLGSKAGAYQGADISVVGEVRQQLVEALQPYIEKSDQASE